MKSMACVRSDRFAGLSAFAAAFRLPPLSGTRPSTLGVLLPALPSSFRSQVSGFILLLLLFGFVFANSATAANLTWTISGNSTILGGAGTWNATSSNWTDNTTLSSWTSGADAVFDTVGTTTALPTITVNGTQSLSSLTSIKTGNGTAQRYTVTAGTLSFTGDALITVNYVMNIASNITTPTNTLYKTGTDILYLGGSAGQFTGNLVVNAGTVYAFRTLGSVTNILGTSSTVTLNNGSAFGVYVGPGLTVNQTIAGVTIGTGANTISISTVFGTSTLDVGTITRNVGSGSVNFNIGAPATQTIKFSNSNDASGIIGPWATFGTDWAANDGTGKLMAYTSYTLVNAKGSTIASGANTNVKISAPGSGANTNLNAGTTVINTLMLGTGPGTVDVGSGNTLQVGGIWVNANAALTIGASVGSGKLTAKSSELFVNASANSLTINSVIADVDGSTPTVLTFMGGSTRTMALAAANTFTGATYNNSATINLNNQNALQNSTLTMKGGSIVFNSSVVANAFTLGGLSAASSGAGYDLALQNNAGTPAAITLSVGGNNANTTYAGVLSASGTLTKIGTGTLTLSGNNTYTGKTAVQRGTVSYTTGNVSPTANQSLGANPDLDLGVAVTSSGILNYSGTGGATLAKNINALGNGADTIQNSTGSLLTLTGTITKNGTVLTLKGGTGGITVSGTGTIAGSNSGSDLVVDGGIVTLDTANTYNGPTYIRNGATLNANVTNALPTANGRSALVLDDVGSGSSQLVLGADQLAASLVGASTSSVNLGAHSLTLGTTGGTTNFAGAISGAGGSIIKNNNSTQTFSGNNSSAGTTTVTSGTLILNAASGGAALGTSGVDITGGTLQLGANNQIKGTATMTLNGGTFDAQTFANSLGTLTLSSNSTISLGPTAAIAFADSSALPWSGTLSLTGFVSGNNQLKFGTSTFGLTPTQLGLFSAAGVASFGLDASGYLTAVPEPSTWALLAFSLTTVMVLRRRRQ